MGMSDTLQPALIGKKHRRSREENCQRRFIPLTKPSNSAYWRV
jgi:hypothetical protein